MTTMSTRRRLGTIAIISAFGLVAGLAGGALALSWKDVSGFFEPSIDELTDSGCAAGYPDGTFKPKQNPTREQFAYWTTNCGGRVAHTAQTNTLTFANSENVALTDTITTSGATGSGQTQYLRVTGTAEVGGDAQDFATFCSSLVECNIDVELHVNSPGNPSGEVASHQASWITGYSSPNELETITVDAVVEVPTGSSITYSLRVQGTNLNASQGKVKDRTLTGQIIPFAG